MPELKAENNSKIVKKSINIAGHSTSITLENAFWNALQGIADDKSMTVNALINYIDRHRKGNLSSAVRLYVLNNLCKKIDNLTKK